MCSLIQEYFAVKRFHYADRERDWNDCIYNFWFTGSGRNLHWGKIRFYFDGEATSRIECDAVDFFNSLHEPFAYPFPRDGP